MKDLGMIRLGLLGVLLLLLSWYIYEAFIGYAESPIGIKEQLKYGQIKFFPAVTICPNPEPEFENEISFNANTTFERAVEMAMRPQVYNKMYMTYK